MRKSVEAYLKEVERCLFAYPRKKRAAFLNDFRGDIYSYLEDHPMASVQELQSFFGMPEDIAESLFYSNEFSTTKRIFSSRQRIVRIVLIAACALVAAAMFLGAVCVIRNYSTWKKQLSQGETAEFKRENYEIVISGVPWEEALADARERGGSLVCFETMEEYRFVLDLIAETGRVENMYFSLGGRRDPYSDTYYWVDSDDRPYGKPLNGTGGWSDECWGPGEPSLIYEKRHETIVALLYSFTENRWAWYDSSPTYRNPNWTYGYIIEYPNET